VCGAELEGFGPSIVSTTFGGSLGCRGCSIDRQRRSMPGTEGGVSRFQEGPKKRKKGRGRRGRWACTLVVPRRHGLSLGGPPPPCDLRTTHAQMGSDIGGSGVTGR